jgi:colicin import membrane protein
MSSERIEKLKRLIAFRERQRDLAAADMENARHAEDEAAEKKSQAEKELVDELEVCRNAVGTGVFPRDLELAAQSARWAAIALRQKEVELAQKKQETDVQRKKLLESHRKVKQMENLHQRRKKESDRERTLSEQSELDDLAVVREVHS